MNFKIFVRFDISLKISSLTSRGSLSWKFFLFITLFSLLYTTCNPQPSHKHPYVSPAFFKLAVQWPASYCNTPEARRRPCTVPIPQKFTVHGLWPYDLAGKLVPNCQHGNPLTGADVSDIKGELERQWPNLAADDFIFWASEWAKHGRCLYGMTPRRYIETALDLFAQVGPLRQILLEGNGLSPHPSDTHFKDVFPIAVFNQIYAVTEIKCNADDGGRGQLQEIHFCTSTTGVLLNCSYANRHNAFVTHNCPNWISYPSQPPVPRAPSLLSWLIWFAVSMVFRLI